MLPICQYFTLSLWWGPIPARSDIRANKQAKCLHLYWGSWATSWYVADICFPCLLLGRSKKNPQAFQRQAAKQHVAVKSPPLRGRGMLVTDFVWLLLAEGGVVPGPKRHTSPCKHRLLRVAAGGSPYSMSRGNFDKKWGSKPAISVVFLNINHPSNFPVLHPRDSLYLCFWPVAVLFPCSLIRLCVCLPGFPDHFKTCFPIPASGCLLALLSPFHWHSPKILKQLRQRKL